MKACTSATSAGVGVSPVPNGPHGLVGDHEMGRAHARRDRAAQLLAHHVERTPDLALLARFANTNDRSQPHAARSFGLGAHLGIAFAVIGAALRMPEDDIGRAEVDQHLGRDVACIGPRRFGMHILRADI